MSDPRAKRDSDSAGIPPPPHPERRRQPLPSQYPKPLEEDPGAAERIQAIVKSRAYREADEAHADAETIVERIMRGEYSAPAQVIAFNVEKGWVRDVSAQIARALIERVGRDGMPEHVRCFVERHVVCLAY